MESINRLFTPLPPALLKSYPFSRLGVWGRVLRIGRIFLEQCIEISRGAPIGKGIKGDPHISPQIVLGAHRQFARLLYVSDILPH